MKIPGKRFMEWKINTQLGRRNLPPAQRLSVMDKFRKKIQEQAATKASESRSRFHGNQYVEVCSPNGDHTKIKTDKELAKMAGVSEKTYRMGAKILDSDNGDYFIIKKYFFSELNTYIFEQIRRIQVCVV